MKIKPAIIIPLCVLLSGCFTPEPKSLTSDRAPSAGARPSKTPARPKDKKSIPRLITDLDDPDPAIRFAAIYALAEITGQTFDYYYYDDAADRRAAVERWQAWLKDHPVSSGNGK